MYVNKLNKEIYINLIQKMPKVWKIIDKFSTLRGRERIFSISDYGVVFHQEKLNFEKLD